VEPETDFFIYGVITGYYGKLTQMGCVKYIYPGFALVMELSMSACIGKEAIRAAIREGFNAITDKEIEDAEAIYAEAVIADKIAPVDNPATNNRNGDYMIQVIEAQGIVLSKERRPTDLLILESDYLATYDKCVEAERAIKRDMTDDELLEKWNRLNRLPPGCARGEHAWNWFGFMIPE
jgi:hypothetical protein